MSVCFGKTTFVSQGTFLLKVGTHGDASSDTQPKVAAAQGQQIRSAVDCQQ
jgi:hypothetical protein